MPFVTQNAAIERSTEFLEVFVIDDTIPRAVRPMWKKIYIYVNVVACKPSVCKASASMYARRWFILSSWTALQAAAIDHVANFAAASD